MATNYRNSFGNFIDFDQWKTELKDLSNNKEVLITKENYEITVTKKFVGTSGSLFKVIVDCSEDCADYHGYHKGFQGEVSAQTDYDRVVNEINNDNAIMLNGKIIE